MQNLTTVGSFFIIVLFLVPGFLAARIFRGGNPVAKEDSNVKIIITALLFSLLVHGVMLSFTALVIGDLKASFNNIQHSIKYGISDSTKFNWITVFWFFATIFICPVIVGVTTSKVWRMRSLQRFFRFLGLSVIDSTPTAWDWTLATRLEHGGWVIAEMDDGSFVGGLYGGKSFASLSPNHNDIYLEVEYNIGQNKEFLHPVGNSLGVWVSVDKVKYMHFYYSEGE